MRRAPPCGCDQVRSHERLTHQFTKLTTERQGKRICGACLALDVVDELQAQDVGHGEENVEPGQRADANPLHVGVDAQDLQGATADKVSCVFVLFVLSARCSRRDMSASSVAYRTATSQ